MHPHELDRPRSQRPPRITTAFVFLAAFAIIISWLIVYAVPNALAAGHIIPPVVTAEDDPRPRWMLWIFSGLFVGFTILGILLGWTSHRQLSRIDAMVEDEG